MALSHDRWHDVGPRPQRSMSTSWIQTIVFSVPWHALYHRILAGWSLRNKQRIGGTMKWNIKEVETETAPPPPGSLCSPVPWSTHQLLSTHCTFILTLPRSVSGSARSLIPRHPPTLKPCSFLILIVAVQIRADPDGSVGAGGGPPRSRLRRTALLLMFHSSMGSSFSRDYATLPSLCGGPYIAPVRLLTLTLHVPKPTVSAGFLILIKQRISNALRAFSKNIFYP